MRCHIMICCPPWTNLAYSWGPSAGGLSVGSQFVANGGDNEGLFRAGLMFCGSLLPTGDISAQQPYFESVVTSVGCATSEDKLDCLRTVPAENITAAVASLPNFFGYNVSMGLCGSMYST